MADSMAVSSIPAEVMLEFTEDSLEEQHRVVLLHAEECFDRYILCEALPFHQVLSKMRVDERCSIVLVRYSAQ